jgi:hypothetical protein
MKKNNKKTFLKVDYDLLSSTELHSTQKLFIAYIIGWQRNEKVCRETNKNLANKFGMKYSGIRTLIRNLNKYDFFESISYDYNESNNTSGHEMKVDETKLKSFLDLVSVSKTDVKIPNESEDETRVCIDESEDETSVRIEESEDEITMCQTKISGNNKIDLTEAYDIEIDSTNDMTSNTSVMEEYYLTSGDNHNYRKAKVLFDDGDYVIGDVIEINTNNKIKYIELATFESFVKKYQAKKEE